jgi:hypothetical protein
MGENPREASQVDNFRTAYRQGWFGLLRTLVHFQKWDEILSSTMLPEYGKPREQAWKHWARSLALAARKQAAEAKKEAAAMDQSLKELAAKTKDEVPLPLQGARRELDGHIAIAQGNLDKGFRGLQKAARTERALRYNEPPAYPRPVLEAIGHLAIQHGRLQVAENAFRQALEQYPESRGALAGLNETLRREGKTVSAGD